MAAVMVEGRLRRFPLTEITAFGAARLYFVVGTLGAFVCLFLSLLVRLQLQAPGLQYFSDSHAYNVVVFGHGLAGTYFALLPLLFASFGVIIAADPGSASGRLNILATRTIAYPWAPRLAALLFAVGLSLLIVSMLEAIFNTSSTSAGWKVYAPLSSNVPDLASLGLVTYSLVIACAALMVAAAHMLALALFRRSSPDRQTSEPISAGALGMVLASLLVLFALPFRLAADLDPANPRLALMGIPSLMAAWNIFLIFDPTRLVLMLAALSVVSLAVERAANRPSVTRVGETLAIGLYGFWSLADPIAQAAASNSQIGWVLSKGPLQTLALLSWPLLAVIWTVTFARGRSRQAAPAVFAAMFLFIWGLGIASEAVLANQGVNRALHDTYYVVASQHLIVHVLVAFAFFAGWYAIFPQIWGRLYEPRLAIIQAVDFLVGTMMTFIPQFALGLSGMPVHYADYPAAFERLNYYSSQGSYLALSSLAIFAVIPWFAQRLPR